MRASAHDVGLSPFLRPLPFRGGEVNPARNACSCKGIHATLTRTMDPPGILRYILHGSHVGRRTRRADRRDGRARAEFVHNENRCLHRMSHSTRESSRGFEEDTEKPSTGPSAFPCARGGTVSLSRRPACRPVGRPSFDRRHFLLGQARSEHF